MRTIRSTQPPITGQGPQTLLPTQVHQTQGGNQRPDPRRRLNRTAASEASKSRCTSRQYFHRRTQRTDVPLKRAARPRRPTLRVPPTLLEHEHRRIGEHWRTRRERITGPEASVSVAFVYCCDGIWSRTSRRPRCRAAIRTHDEARAHSLKRNARQARSGLPENSPT